MIKSLGDENENETQIHAILEEFSLPYVFPKEVLKEAEKIKIEYDKKDWNNKEGVCFNTRKTMEIWWFFYSKKF